MQDLVKRFHQKYDYAYDMVLKEWCSSSTDDVASDVGRMLAELAEVCSNIEHPVLWRLHLMLEELAEVCDALVQRDEAQLTKELADLLYVVLGSGVTFDLPLEDAFHEIHRANMTRHKDYKKLREDSITRPYRNGDKYEKPDIQGALKRWRLKTSTTR